MIQMSTSGSWSAAVGHLAKTAQRIDGSLQRAVLKEAHYLRTLAVQGITRQAPGGSPIRSLAQLTLAKRHMLRFGGTKALLVRADLRNSIAVVLRHSGAFVGVSRTARDSQGHSLLNVAEVQEYGFRQPRVVRLTPRMRWFLMALLRRAGVPRKRRSEAVGGHSRVVVLSVPPRPFMQPAWDKFSHGLHERMLRHLGELARGWT